MSYKQLKSADTRTVNEYFYPFAPDAYFPLECDGELVDWLEPYEIEPGVSSIEAHSKVHFKDGKMCWILINIKGYAKSQWTDEIYHMNELNKIYLDDEGGVEDFIVHTHARGENGNNIILTTKIVDFYNFEFDIVKAVCTNQ